MSRNAIEVYDPEAIQQKVQLEVRQKMAASGQQPQRIDPNAPIFRMFAEVAAKEAAKFREREEERRRRDPTYRPDAIDLNEANVRAFDEKVRDEAGLGLANLVRQIAIDAEANLPLVALPVVDEVR